MSQLQRSLQLKRVKLLVSKAMNSELNNGNTLPSSTSSMLREYSSEEMINAPDFVSVQTHGNADHTETVKLETMVQSSTSLLNLGNNEKNYTNSTSHVVEKSSSVDSVTLDDSNVVKSCKYVNGHQNHQPETERMTSASRTLNVRSEVDGMHSVPFGGPQKTMGIADLLTRTGKPTIERNDSMRASSPEFVNEARGPRGEKGCVILSLINGIKEIRKGKSNLRSQKGATSNNMDQTSNKTAIEGMQCEAESLRSDNGGRYSPTHGCAMVKETNNFKGSDSTTHGGSLSKLFPVTTPMRKDSKGSGVDISALDSMKSKSSQKIPLPKSKHGFKNTWVAGKEADDNIVLVRFLHASVKRNEIETLFNNCGYIARIDLHKGGLFKMACIYFMAKEGMQNALKETGLILRNTNLVVEAACSKDNIPCKTVIPNLIGYPEVPASFVKNPTRTVMIKELTPDISSHDIGEALAFCGSKISGFFFGSSSYVAYVELATEEAKQRALERNSITVSGKLLRIFRIDAHQEQL